MFWLKLIMINLLILNSLNKSKVNKLYCNLLKEMVHHIIYCLEKYKMIMNW